MKTTRQSKWISITLALFLVSPLGNLAQAAPSMKTTAEATARQAENQIRTLIEPVLDKYCREDCKLMSVNVDVELDTSNELAPGFDDIDPKSASAVAPSGGRVKIMMDEKVGPISRGTLLELVQRFLDNLDYPVKVDTQITRFPLPVGSATKVAELRDKISKQFRTTLDDLFRQFCPDQCLLADYELQTETVNADEAQYGSPGEFVQEGGVALRIKNITGTIVVDDTLTPEERRNIVEMAKLKTNFLKNVGLQARNMKFPRPGEMGEGALLGANGKGKRGLASETKSESQLTDNRQRTDTNNNQTTENNVKQEKFERIEKIERVESGDAVQAELQKFKVAGLVFGCAIMALLVFIAIASVAPRKGGESTIQRIIQNITSDPAGGMTAPVRGEAPTNEERTKLVAQRYEIERLKEDLMAVFAQNPKVAKHVFTRILTEEGIETTAAYIHLFGENVVMDMLRDPSLQSDMSELLEFYAKNPMDLTDEEKLELLKALHNRTIAGKLVVMGSRSSHLFDFLAEMDGVQILELVRNESLTVKAIVMTQCDPQKRAAIFGNLEEKGRMDLLQELSRIDYLPRDYIFNVANALKRKRRDNPRLNTEALPGSEVLLTLLERASTEQARNVIRNLELTNPDSARTVKGKLVNLDTLRNLRDGQLLEVVLSLKHEELIQFLKGAADHVRGAIFSKSPRDLAIELEEELVVAPEVTREVYQTIERKVLNRMKLMANEGLINLVETNERMLAGDSISNQGSHPPDASEDPNIRKVAGF